eukprot:TRINITY_DN49754_c0_g1_i1.p1 TRINITY_DN49754_c0_g1~~TRINITY_DN49754_c0_g1_i1.p1  ORF type:complete len:712 (+),score=243.93 TRINITY_DN49754_c0_g1_i1:100-2235(+)
MKVKSVILTGVALATTTEARLDATPMKKVLDMLGKLKEELTAEAAKEKGTYTEFNTFCEDTKAEKTSAINENNLKAESAASSYASKQADLGQIEDDVKRRKVRHETLSTELSESEKQCNKDSAAFDGQEADLLSAVSGLEGAIEKLETAKEAGAFIQIGTSLKKSLNLAEVMGFLKGKKKEDLSSLLQKPAWQETDGYNKEDYSFQSGSIVDTLKGLLTQFKGELTTAQDEYKKTSTACSDTKTSKTAAIESNQASLRSGEEDASALRIDIADEQKTEMETKKTLKEDKAYLAEVEENCAARTKDFTQRTKMREQEMQAIAEATKALSGNVEDLDKAVGGREAPAFLQHSNLLRKSARQAVVRSVATEKVAVNSAALAKTSLANKVSRDAVIRTLTESAKSTHSARMMALVEQIKAVKASAPGDIAKSPLASVKEMVQGLVNKLIEEATAEATKKGDCDTVMGQAKQERNRRLNEANKLSAKLKSLETKRVELIDTNDLDTNEVKKLRDALVEATNLRTDESSENQLTIKQAKEGVAAVKQAVEKLSSFYKNAALSAKKYNSLLQVSSSKADPKAGFKGAYGANQGAGSNIINMMEVIQADFAASAKKTKEAEDAAADAFSKLKSQSNQDIASKETALKMNTEELSNAKLQLKQGSGDLAELMKLLDGALQTMEDYKAQCVDNSQSYEERKAQRDKQIADLKTALDLLTEE